MCFLSKISTTVNTIPNFEVCLKVKGLETLFLIESLNFCSLTGEPAGLCGKPHHVAGMLFIGIQSLHVNSFPKTVSQCTKS